MRGGKKKKKGFWKKIRIEGCHFVVRCSLSTPRTRPAAPLPLPWGNPGPSAGLVPWPRSAVSGVAWPGVAARGPGHRIGAPPPVVPSPTTHQKNHASSSARRDCLTRPGRPGHRLPHPCPRPQSTPSIHPLGPHSGRRVPHLRRGPAAVLHHLALLHPVHDDGRRPAHGRPPARLLPRLLRPDPGGRVCGVRGGGRGGQPRGGRGGGEVGHPSDPADRAHSPAGRPGRPVRLAAGVGARGGGADRVPGGHPGPVRLRQGERERERREKKGGREREKRREGERERGAPGRERERGLGSPTPRPSPLIPPTPFPHTFFLPPPPPRTSSSWAARPSPSWSPPTTRRARCSSWSP